ncbi:hypothetical protein AAZX31_14G057400 [Glycine max]
MDGDSSRRSSTAEDDGDPAVWEAFNESLSEVPSVLDRNRLLIEQVNENQHSRLRDNMVTNVSLIRSSAATSPRLSLSTPISPPPWNNNNTPRTPPPTPHVANHDTSRDFNGSASSVSIHVIFF